jgi:hypothetical protein
MFEKQKPYFKNSFLRICMYCVAWNYMEEGEPYSFGKEEKFKTSGFGQHIFFLNFFFFFNFQLSFSCYIFFWILWMQSSVDSPKIFECLQLDGIHINRQYFLRCFIAGERLVYVKQIFKVFNDLYFKLLFSLLFFKLYFYFKIY